MLWWIAVAMMVGYFAFGSLAGRLAKVGIPPAVPAAGGMGVFLLIQLLLVLTPEFGVALWPGFGFFGTASILPYAVLAQAFPRHLTGRSNTSLNLLVFVGAFAAQWLIGAVVGLWPMTGEGGSPPVAYQAGFLLLIGAQILAAGWYFLSGRGAPEGSGAADRVS
jgi:hypothetical protein